jgi:hypothetical protein
MFDETCTDASNQRRNRAGCEHYTHLKLNHDVLNLLLEPADGICLLLGLDQSFGKLEKLGLLVDRRNACVDGLAYFRNDPAGLLAT